MFLRTLEICGSILVIAFTAVILVCVIKSVAKGGK